MTSVSQFLSRLEDRYYERAWYRSGLFWMMTLLCAVAHYRVIEAFAAAWPGLAPQARFLAGVAVAGLHTPWLATLTYHARTRERMLAEASAALRREMGRVHTFAVGFLYFLLVVIVGVLSR